MRVITHDTALTLREQSYRWLENDEAVNNGLITIVDLLAQGTAVYSRPFWLATVEIAGEVVGCGIHVKPDGLVIGEMPEAAYDAVFDSVNHHVGAPHRILAPVNIAESLACRWEAEGDLRKSAPQYFNCNRLHSLIPPKIIANGRLRRGQDSDRKLVEEWGQAYAEEKPVPVDVPSFMARKLRRRELFIWEDNSPKTVITLSGPTENGIRLSSVFTPVSSRGHGYATSAVATISENQLNSGKNFVVLVTQKGDAAERMYHRLGYQKIGERCCYMLDSLLQEPN